MDGVGRKGPELVQAWQVAQRLGVSRGTVYRWVRKGRIPAGRVKGGKLLLNYAAVLKALGLEEF